MDDLEDMFGGGEDEVVESRPVDSGVLAFHTGTEEALFMFVKNNSTMGDTLAVLRAIDEFCYKRHWMMHIGDKKLSFLYDAIDTMKSLHCNEAKRSLVELGSYCGYSAISIASRLEAGRDMLYSVENNEQCCGWTQRLVDYAGVSDRVTVIRNQAGNCEQWKECLQTTTIHLLFIDHDKRQYLSDLKTIEAAGLLSTNAVVVADNVVMFGLTEYFAYVRDPSGPFKSSQLFESTIEYATTDKERENIDGIEVSIHR